MTRMLARLSCAILLLSTVAAHGRDLDLDEWLDRELIPHVTGQLTQHPRFRDETILFVVLENDSPAPVTNSLALALRDRLLDAAVDAPGINVAWRQQPHAGDSCHNDEPDYLVGIELLRDPDGGYRARARAMDLVEGSRVSGFGLAWEGVLSRRQLAAFRETATDPAFRGSREVPYTADQSDLVARHLSHALSCQIFSGLDDDYVLALGTAETAATPLAGTIELATRNLDASNAVVLTTNASRATARVDGKAHRIAGALHQYWLSITPLGDGGIDSLSASVYVRMADTGTDAADPLPDIDGAIHTAGAASVSGEAPARIDGVMMPGDERQRLIRPLSVYRAGSSADCRYDASRCTLLHARATDDVIVFTLMHAPGRGLLQLATDECRAHSAARVLTAGHSALFPIPDSGTRTRNVKNGGRWLIEPGNTTYYAVAVDNARDARRVAALVDRLPALCASYAESGVRGYALQQWLESLSHLMLELGPRAEWRAVEVNPV
ncbi:MAG: hypothetical protein V2I25_07530 [Woeseiaceae bacterium]|nr:hypothetical protein [Woeseiaceae bacterium]